MNQPLHNMTELLFRLLDNDICDGDFETLSNWLESDIEAKRFYCRFMQDYGALSLRKMTEIQPCEAEFTDDPLNEDLWSLLSQEEQTAPAVEIKLPESAKEDRPVRKVEKPPVVRSVNKVSLWAAIVSVAALICMIAYLHLAPPSPYEVAMVSDSINAQWSSGMSPKAGTRILSYNKPIQLTQGIVKIVTDNGVEVVLEAPTEFRFLSYSQLDMNYGKLFAHVSEQGHGFSVTTPNATIVDLGTEFGVLSHIDGNTEVHMYKGRANVFAGRRDQKKISELLTAGSAKKIDRMDSALEEIPLVSNLIVRNISSESKFVWKGEPLSLADIVGGGSGFGTGHENQGIDISTGSIISQLPSIDAFQGSATYISVPSNPYVDGLFIPGIHPESTQLTSNQLQTDAFPQTSGSVWGYVFNGAWHEGLDVPRHTLKLDGFDFRNRENSAITMHSNLGITFDLDAIRAKLPGVNIRSFSTAFGISNTVESWLNKRNFNEWEMTSKVQKLSEANQSTAEFWIFLDDRKVLQKTVSSGSGPGTITVPVDKTIRFLTLAVTEAEDTFMFDWAVFARPELVLESNN